MVHPAKWNDGKVGFLFTHIFVSMEAAALAFVASVIVIIVFRAKFQDEKPGPDPDR